MNLKQLLHLKAASGKQETGFTFDYMLSAFTAGVGSGSAKCVRVVSGQAAYAGCYGTKATTNPIYNNTGDSEVYYPILLNGAKKLSFQAPESVKVTVFFVNTAQRCETYNAAAWVDGDASAYDSSVPNGNREVNVPEGADAFTFSVYYKSNTVTDEVMSTISVAKG